MKKFLATLFGAAILLMATPAQAHHVISLDVAVNCDGFSGQAVLEVFDGHKYQVTAPGFDTGIVTTDEDSTADDDVTVPFSGTATSGTVTATIFTPSGTVEDTKSQPFALEEDCIEPTPSPTPTETPTPAPTTPVAEPSPSPTAPAESPPAAVPPAGDSVEAAAESQGSVAGASEVREDVLPVELARTGLSAASALGIAVGLLIAGAVFLMLGGKRRRRASH